VKVAPDSSAVRTALRRDLHGLLDGALNLIDDEIGSGLADPEKLGVGYATTIHKAQGVTVDRCFVLIEDSTSREQAYTAMSRGRLGNDLYVEGITARPDESRAHELPPDAIERLRRHLRRSIGQQLAIHQLARSCPGPRQCGEHDGLGL